MLTRLQRRLLPALALLVVFTPFAVVQGCGRAINRSAERRIRDILPGVLGPAREYRVHVDSSASRTIHGQLSNVTVDGDDVQFPNGLLVDNLHLDLKNVDVDTRRRVLRGIGAAHFAATISAKTLDEFLVGESPDDERLRNTHVTIGADNRVTITSERVVLGVGVPFQLTGPLVITGPSRLEFDARHLNIIGIGLTGRPLQFLKSRFERAIDVSSLPFPVTLTKVSTVPGSVTLEGDADVTALLQRAQAAK